MNWHTHCIISLPNGTSNFTEVCKQVNTTNKESIVEYCNVQCASCGATLYSEPMEDGDDRHSKTTGQICASCSCEEEQQQQDYNDDDYYDDY